MTKILEQRVIDDSGKVRIHKEQPSRTMPRPIMRGTQGLGVSEVVQAWENGSYYGLLRRFSAGFPLGGGPYAVISISAADDTARHDWRDFQQIKNHLVGEEWEAVELYPAESRLKDPSNRFYLWCVPKGVFNFGLPGGRSVLSPSHSDAPQRPFPAGSS